MSEFEDQVNLNEELDKINIQLVSENKRLFNSN